MEIETNEKKRLNITDISGIELTLPESEEIFHVRQLENETLISSDKHLIAIVKKDSKEKKTTSGIKSFAWLLVAMIVVAYILANTFYQNQIDNYYTEAQAEIIKKITNYDFSE